VIAIQKKFKKLSKQKFDATVRENEIGLFKEALHTPQLEHNIFVFHGAGRVGKTALLVHFWSICRKEKIPVAVVSSEEHVTVLNALQTLREQMPSGRRFINRYFKKFDHDWKQAQRIRTKLEKRSGQSLATLMASAGISAQVTTSLTAAGVGVGPVAAGVVLVGEVVNRVLGIFRRHGLSQKESEFLLHSEMLLTKELALGINEVAQKRHAVLLIDGYEYLRGSEGMEFWVRDALLARLSTKRVIVVIAARYRLEDTKWKAWSPVVCQVELPAAVSDVPFRGSSK
jgi:hypothetical protein